jgi:hypothetical protein
LRPPASESGGCWFACSDGNRAAHTEAGLLAASSSRAAPNSVIALRYRSRGLLGVPVRFVREPPAVLFDVGGFLAEYAGDGVVQALLLLLSLPGRAFDARQRRLGTSAVATLQFPVGESLRVRRRRGLRPLV